MLRSSGWEPLLDGALADEARRAIRDIAWAIHAGAGTRRTATELALFWAYLCGAIDEAWTAASYDEACSELCASLWTTPDLRLHGGLAGAGWVLAHISEDGSADDVLEDVDEALLRALDVEPWTGDFDLISGLVGYGVYFLERMRASRVPSAERGLRRIVEHLVATSERTPEGVAWYSGPALLPAWQREHAPDGFFNCGLAHGTPGVIGILGRIAALGAEPGVQSLCNDAMAWLRAQEIVGDPRGRYPDLRRREQPERRAARTAWCYGDPGVAVAGWSAAAGLQQPIDEWRELARSAAMRAHELCGVVDAGLCHGSAGLAHIFNRCYQASGDAVLRDAARSWFQRTLAMRGSDGIAGFAANAGDAEARQSARLVDGAVGVALALLAAVGPVEPCWDRLLLCDLPVRGGRRAASES